MQTIIDKYQLYNTPEEILIFPDSSIIIENAQVMRISKKTGSISYVKEIPKPESPSQQIHGVIGIHSVEKSKYLIVIT